MIRVEGPSRLGRWGVSFLEQVVGLMFLGVGLVIIAVLFATAGTSLHLESVLPPASRSGFTLVELLVVLSIVAVIAAVTLPVVIPAISHRQVGESTRIIQAALVGARDASLRTNTPHGIRFLPDPIHDGLDPKTPAKVNPFKVLASNRFVPIEQPPGYSEGRVFLDVDGNYSKSTGFGGRFLDYPGIASGLGLDDGGASTGRLYDSQSILMVVQSVYKEIAGANPRRHEAETPTSWYWNIRAGDKIQINNLGPYFTVVGPMGIDNPEKFVNVDPRVPTLRLVDSVKREYFFPEYLFVVNGEDDDGDGYVDNGWDGLDNDLDGEVDNLAEWSEIENWPIAYGLNMGATGVGGGLFNGVPYRIVRRPVPSPGARETVLPGGVVVDLTTWDRTRFTPERSRLPVDPLSGNVDVMLDPGGRVLPTTRYSSPASSGLADSFYHVWVAERNDLAEVVTTVSGEGLKPKPLAPSPHDGFFLPMPLGRNAAGKANAYDLLAADSNLPHLSGRMALLSISTRTGNMITTDDPTFNVSDVNQPYRAAQMGQQGETP